MRPRHLLSLAAALVLACLLSPLASEKPDGLDKFAQDHGIEATAEPFWSRAPMAEYAAPFMGGGALATGIAGGAGTILVFAALLVAGRALTRQRQSQTQPLEGPCEP